MPTVVSGRYTASYTQRKPKLVGGLSIALPEYRQEDCYSCGFCAALTVAHYFNPSTDDVAVLQAVQPLAGSGTTQKKVINGLAILGITARYRDDLTVENLRGYVSIGVPVIISVWPDGWVGDHWTVIRGFTPTRRVHMTNHWANSARGFVREWIENWEEGPYGAGLVCTKH